MYPEPIKKLAVLFSRLPGIGPRMGTRLAFHLLKMPASETKEFAQALEQLHLQMRLCGLCFNPFSQTDQKQTLCSICADQTRTQTLLCVVEKESDLEALEATKSYHGLYFVLGGTVGMLRKSDMKHLRLEELQNRLQGKEITEAILATNLTAEGEATALYLERLFAACNIQTTRLGRGLPVGGELEYSDPETLRQSIENRR